MLAVALPQDGAGKTIKMARKLPSLFPQPNNFLQRVSLSFDQLKSEYTSRQRAAVSRVTLFGGS
jgi:hypothetical protein